ncbi:hypothetical protein ACJX0J_032913, partial [Zea mays]
LPAAPFQIHWHFSEVSPKVEDEPMSKEYTSDYYMILMCHGFDRNNGFITLQAIFF